METGVVLQHDDTPRECEGMLSLDRGKKVAEGCAVALRIDDDDVRNVRIF
jgi:hypothetical protein